MNRQLLAAALVAAAMFGVGCAQSGTPEIETYQVTVVDPINEAKAILTNYANGMPVTSEADSYPDLIKRVKEKDAAKGDILEKGLMGIKANPATARPVAIELLKQL